MGEVVGLLMGSCEFYVILRCGFMKNFTKLLLLFSLILKTSIVIAEEKPCIRVGVNIPMSGFLANYGNSIQEGVILAFEDSSNRNNVSFDWQDNKSQAKETVSIFQKQIGQGFNLYITGVKPQFMVIADLLNKANVPNFAWVFDTNVRSNGDNNFRTWVNFRSEPKLFSEYASSKNPKKIAIIYVQL